MNSAIDMVEIQRPLISASNGTEDNEDFDDTASGTSTIAYGMTPFEAIKDKVAELVGQAIDKSSSKIQVERMKGGSYNRVISARVVPRRASPSCTNWFYCRLRRLLGKQNSRDASPQYIMRIPRGASFGGVTSQVAVLRALKPRLSFPIPQVIGYDDTSENDLGQPYMIQERLPGQTVSDMWDHLNLEQKKSIAKRVAELTSEIVSIQAAPGDISNRNLTTKFLHPLYIDTKNRIGGNHCEPAEFQTSAQFIINKLEFWHARVQKREYMEWLHAIWDSLKAVVQNMDKRGLFALPTALYHADLREYNLLMEIRSTTEVEITGVIDWDEASIAPAYMAYRAPTWLWMPDEWDFENDNLVNDEPLTEDGKELKAHFMEHASEDFKRHAFSMESMLARRMYYIIENGMRSEYAQDMVKEIVADWDKLHPEDGVAIRDVYADAADGDSNESDDDDSEDSGDDVSDGSDHDHPNAS